ncbi:MAG: hypothetical protein ACP5NF_09020 [Thermoanaerobaculum sp.]
MTEKGLLGLSADAMEAFGFADATHVLMFFDPERRIIGLRKADARETGAMRLTRRKRVASLSIRPLLEEHRLVVPGKLIMEPVFDEKENLLLIPLLGVRVRPGRRPAAPMVKALRLPSRTRAAAARRGRPAKAAAAPEAPARRGRPRKSEAPAPAAAPKRRGRPPKKAEAAPSPAPKRRGRPSKSEATAASSDTAAPKRRGRPRKAS